MLVKYIFNQYNGAIEYLNTGKDGNPWDRLAYW
jgi:hypothetical protein